MDNGAITKHRQEILELAAKYRLPVVSIYRDFANSGGLIAYGPNLDIVYRRAAHFVDKLIKGERASDLPVEQPVIFDLVINQKAAKTLEPISKLSEEDNEAGELDKAEEVLGVEFPADQYAALPLYPGEETLDEPASHIAA